MRILPVRTAPITEGIVENMAWTWPPTRSTSAGPAPLYAMWTTSMPAFILKSSIDSCGEVPTPADA